MILVLSIDYSPKTSIKNDKFKLDKAYKRLLTNNKQQNKMNIHELGEMCENLQIFIALKNQHLIIHAWMELKKINKRMDSCHSSRAKSNVSSFISQRYRNPLKEGHSYYPSNGYSKNNSMLNLHNDTKRQLKQHDVQEERGQMLITFNKSPPQKLQYLTEKKVNKYQGHKMSSQLENDKQLQDSGQFEDIVLDRLSKLQENINKMMREKKVKDDSRGYVGTPINSNIHLRKVHKGSPPLYPKNKKNQTSVMNSKKHQYVPQINPITCQIQKSSLIKTDTFNQMQQSGDKQYKVKNMKNQYEQSKVNVNKIKQILQNNKIDEQTLREEVNFLNQNRRKWEQQQKKLKGRNSIQQFSNREQSKYQTGMKERNMSNVIQNKANDSIVNQYQVISTTRTNPNKHIPIRSQIMLENGIRTKQIKGNNQFVEKNQGDQKTGKNILNQPYFKPQDIKPPFYTISTKMAYYPQKLKNSSSYY